MREVVIIKENRAKEKTSETAKRRNINVKWLAT
jgi:hypothetical protein